MASLFLAGSSSPRIVFVAEAWGEQEELWRQPLVGAAGRELMQWLLHVFGAQAPDEAREIREAMKWGMSWVRHRDAFLTKLAIAKTNVFNLRPEGNRLASLCWEKSELPPGYGLPPVITHPRNLYVRSEHLHHLERLRTELDSLRPNIVVALGNTALWALCGETKIGSLRGTIRNSSLCPLIKVLPTYHPAAILHGKPEWRPIAMADCIKVARESLYPEIRRTSRQILISPSIEECEAWTAEAERNPPAILACDTETKIGQISMISFARDPTDCLVIPFCDWSHANGSYWESSAEEFRAWNCVERLLRLPSAKLFQNGPYDYQYILPLGFSFRGPFLDTMLRHHSLIPESRKDLGFLGSLYTSEPAWKLMRLAKSDTEKRDE